MEDIGFMRADADFNLKIIKDLYWVPVNVLGRSRYSNNEMKKIISLTPKEKKKN